MSATVQAIVVGGEAHGEVFELADFRWLVRIPEHRQYPEPLHVRDMEVRQIPFGPWLFNVLVEPKDWMNTELIGDALMTTMHKATGLGQRVEVGA